MLLLVILSATIHTIITWQDIFFSMFAFTDYFCMLIWLEERNYEVIGIKNDIAGKYWVWYISARKDKNEECIKFLDFKTQNFKGCEEVFFDSLTLFYKIFCLGHFLRIFQSFPYRFFLQNVSGRLIDTIAKQFIHLSRI